MNSVVANIFRMMAYIAFQLLVLKHLAISNVAFCLLYVSFILCLPFKWRTIYVMLLGFCMGLVIDVFYDFPGLHASALVAIAFIRGYWFKILEPPIGYEEHAHPSVHQFGVIWFLTYIGPLVFLHHTLLFFVEAAGGQLFGYSMLKAFSSTIFTLTAILILEYLSPRSKRR